MVDPEKVRKGLEHCCDPDRCDADCPYYKDYDEVSDCMSKIAGDALALLKEQGAVEPTFKQGEDGVFVWACGSCGAYMYHIYDGFDKAKEYAKYCRQCGRKVKW